MAYTKSELVQAAELALSQAQASRPQENQSSYTNQIQQVLDSVVNRQPLNYDYSQDPTYQQYKNQYKQQGLKAMQDTTAQATALSGGFGNSYAQSVGNQQYQEYLKGANDIIPSLQTNAQNQYNQGTSDLLNQLSALQSADSMEYTKGRDKVSDYYNDVNLALQLASNEYSKDYGAYRDNVSDTQTDRDYAYQVAQDKLTQDNYEREWAYQLAADAKAEAEASRSSSRSGSSSSSDSEGAYLDSEMKSALKSAYKDSFQAFTDYLDYLEEQGISEEEIDAFLEKNRLTKWDGVMSDLNNPNSTINKMQSNNFLKKYEGVSEMLSASNPAVASLYKKLSKK